MAASPFLEAFQFGRQIRQQNALRDLAPGLMNGDPNALSEYAKIDPAGALSYQAKQTEMTHSRAAAALDFMSNAAGGLLSLPDQQAAAAYPQVLAQAKQFGIDVSSAPPTYDRGWVQGIAMQSDEYRKRLADMPQPMAGYGGGNALLSSPGGAAPAGNALTDSDYATRIAQYESSGGTNLSSPTSSARGPYQFINSTWLDQVKRNFPQIAQGKTDDQILALRNDPDISKQVLGTFTDENRSELSSFGLPTGDSNLYLAHRFGADGARRLLSAGPQMGVESVLGPQVVAANPDLKGKTVGDVLGVAQQRFGAAPGATGGAGAPVAGGAAGAPAGLIPLQRNGKPWTEGLPQGQVWAADPATGQLRGMDIPGARPPQSLVNINNAGETAFAKASGEAQAKRFNQLIEDGSNATGMISDMTTLRDLAGRIGETGVDTQVRAALGPYIESLGLKVDGLSDMQAFQAVVTRIAPTLRVPGSGATSDFEMENFLKALPGLGKTPEGNGIIQDTLQAIAERKVQAADIASRAINGEIAPAEAEKLLRQLPDPLSLWRQKGRSLPTAGAPPAASGATGATPAAPAPAAGGVIRYDGQGNRVP